MHRVSILNDSKEYTAKDGDVVFDVLDDQGTTLPHGCLSGSCGACRIEVIEGSGNLSEPSDVEKDTIEAVRLNLKRIHGEKYLEGKTVRLSCRAKIKGNILISPLN